MKPECKKYYRRDGSVERDIWHLNSKRHRIDGPAVIDYRKDGGVSSEHWYLNDIPIDP